MPGYSIYEALNILAVHIRFGKGHETMALGIPTFEDKIAQRAVAMLLEPIYDLQDFITARLGPAKAGQRTSLAKST